MMPDEERIFHELHAALAPAALREAVVLCFARWREEFRADLTVSSREAMLQEVRRFVAHMYQCYYATPSTPWPDVMARHDTNTFLARHFGTPWDGEQALWRLASESSMRAVLDLLTRRLQEQALQTYLDLHVLAHLKTLPLSSQLEVVTAYLENFQRLPHQTEHPALVMGRLHETLEKHARIVLGWE